MVLFPIEDEYVPAPAQTECRNRLLRLMSASDFGRLSPHLARHSHARGDVIVEPDVPIERVYFPESGVGSIIATSPDGQECEAGLFGHDGFGPQAAIMGSDRSPHRIIMQVAGDTLGLPRVLLLEAVEASPALRLLLLRFVQVMAVQTAFTALANAVHQIDERLARWLLMSHDRHTADEIPLTHEYMAIMLAVRRPSVTTSLHVLEGNGFIRSERGYVTIRNRKALEEFAADSYGRPEAEYRRLIGPMN